MVDISGECVKCSDYKIVSENKRECVDPVCDSFEIIDVDGVC